MLAEAFNDKGKLTKVSVAARLKEVQKESKRDPQGSAEASEERRMLERYLALVEQEATTAEKLKAAQEKLTAAVAAKYPALTEDEIKRLVVDDKWRDALHAAVQGELDRVSQTLTGRIRQLAERYATPLPQLTAEVEALAVRVDEHLKKMRAKL